MSLILCEFNFCLVFDFGLNIRLQHTILIQQAPAIVKYFTLVLNPVITIKAEEDLHVVYNMTYNTVSILPSIVAAFTLVNFTVNFL